MSQNFDITIPAGESFFFETTIRQSSEPNAQPINFAGFTAVGQLREDWDKPLLASFEIIFLQPRTNGKIRFVLSDEVTRALPVSRARYDIFITDQEGTTRKLLEGIAFITRNEIPAILVHAVDGNDLYIGRLEWDDYPATGQPDDSPAWTIYRITTNSAGDVLSEQSATGAWSNKTNLQFS